MPRPVAVHFFYLTPYETPLLPSAAVEYGDSREIFIATPTASGSKYVGEFGRYVWIKGNNALLVWDQDKPPASCMTNIQ